MHTSQSDRNRLDASLIRGRILRNRGLVEVICHALDIDEDLAAPDAHRPDDAGLCELAAVALADAYRIRVSRGYDAAGKKLKPFQMNWTPPEGISEKKLEKELNRIAVEFEMKCREGEVCTESSMKLLQFCPMYLDLVSESLSPTIKETYARYIDQLIIPALGHMKVSEIKPVHVQRFIKQI